MGHRSDSERSFTNGGLDLIVRSGTIVDGTGAPPVTADIGISGGVLQEIGDLSSVTAADEIDATGLVVTPGIIDVHSHADLTLAIDGRAESALTQGVTTVLVGNCGHGCTPLRDRPEYASAIFGYNRSIPLDWQSTGEYLEKLRQARPGINVGTLVPLGNLRLTAMEDPERPASDGIMFSVRCALGLKRRMRSELSSITIGRSTEARRLSRSLLAWASSSLRCSSSSLSVISSSLLDCSSSFAVSSSSFVDCSSSLLDWISSFAERSSSFIASCSSMIDCR